MLGWSGGGRHEVQVAEGRPGRPLADLMGEEVGGPQASEGVTPTGPAQLSCLANLATWHGLQDDFALHPPDLLLFYK